LTAEREALLRKVDKINNLLHVKASEIIEAKRVDIERRKTEDALKAEQTSQQVKNEDADSVMNEPSEFKVPAAFSAGPAASGAPAVAAGDN